MLFRHRVVTNVLKTVNFDHLSSSGALQSKIRAYVADVRCVGHIFGDFYAINSSVTPALAKAY